jgi:ribosomal protein S12 methylthiotransferase accessory factor
MFLQRRLLNRHQRRLLANTRETTACQAPRSQTAARLAFVAGRLAARGRRDASAKEEDPPRSRGTMASMASGPPQSLLSSLGVSRLARVTTMDRCGIEVMSAVRPTGHVLQVTQGKGMTRGEAQWSALGEAAELLSAERPDPSRLTFARGDALDGFVLDDDGLRRAWIRGERLSDGAHVWVAAERVFCPPRGTHWLGPSTASWSSNGYGAHVTQARALEHSVLEVWERHALAETIPRGWTPRVLERSLVAWAPYLVTQLEARGFTVVPCLLATVPLPLAGVLLFDRDESSVPLTAGYACRRTPEEALTAALLEAAQSRLTEIHGARDDVATGVREQGASLLAALDCLEHQAFPSTRAVKGWPREVSSRVVVVPTASTPLHVVKAIGLGLDESELLR